MNPTSVGVDFSNERVFSWSESKHRFVVLSPELSSWLGLHAFGQYRTKDMQGDCAEQVVGRHFIFDDPKTAVLFKLIWGGS